MILSATVPIDPLPKSRPRFSGGQVYTPQKTAKYEEAVAWTIKPHVTQRNDKDDLKVILRFRTKTKRKCDIDNLVKAVLDSCNKVIWRDDHQITELVVSLTRGSDNPGFDIEVEVAEDKSRFCRNCGDEVTTRQRTFCSKKCYDSKQRKGVYRACSGCGEPVYRKSEKALAVVVYCSNECRARHAQCRVCDKKVVRPAKFCSSSCSDSWHKTRPIVSKLGGSCADCGKRVSRTAARCRGCFLARRRPSPVVSAPI